MARDNTDQPRGSSPLILSRHAGTCTACGRPLIEELRLARGARLGLSLQTVTVLVCGCGAHAARADE